MKTCNKCKETLDLSCFHRDNNAPDGLKYTCKACMKAYHNRRAKTEEAKKKKSVNFKKYVQKNWKSQLIRKCKHNNDDRIKKGRSFGPVTVDVAWVDLQLELQGGRCYWSGVPMLLTSDSCDPHQVSIDRVNNDLGYTKENCVLVCSWINHGRGKYTGTDFMRVLDNLRGHLDYAPSRAELEKL